MVYQLSYLPMAKQDMTEIVKYISHELCNPTAAKKLANEMIEAADKLLAFPYSNAVHVTIRPLKHEYRKLMVKNYIMFYWVDENENENEKRITIARVSYAQRDYENRFEPNPYN